ncbi:MAG TPA: OmpA family protein [Candidatus Eisenbacteria bacterium]|jgi:OmpA-OmpF porin, OOP family|nr:OmpA family protein [Candidatus Eisenbacteria bacterium]
MSRSSLRSGAGALCRRVLVRTPVVVLALALGVALLPVPQASATSFELYPFAGYMLFSNDFHPPLKDHLGFGGKVGLYFGHFGIEGHYTQVSTELDTAFAVPVNTNFKAKNYGGDLVFRFAPDATVVPYILAGAGQLQFTGDDAGVLAGTDAKRFAYDGGIGLLFRLSDMAGLRFEGKDILMKDSDGDFTGEDGKTTSNFLITGGINLAFGGTKDTDKDGVKDKADKCPDTPLGCRVDKDGCPIDSDKDGVCDGVDQCPDTPAGATVDARGCPSDSDKDGVLDGIDQCPDTPAGVAVDARGCPKDSDGDGVTDDKDQCPDTPAGTAVDERGCPKDSDGDGVSDDKDLCPNTPAGARVDKDGCPIEVTEKETQLLDKGVITVHNINFDTGKSDILPGDENVLNEIGKILIQWPQLKIEIGGHTDSRGTNAANQTLSEARANAVRDWLTSHYPQLTADNLTAVGYGESKPIATNKTKAGMAQNRRVEFKVLNTEEITKYKERRKMLMKE